MARGGGRYGGVATEVLLETQADGIIMIVLNGNLGSGFSVAVAEDIVLNVPNALRRLADEIEQDLVLGADSVQ